MKTANCTQAPSMEALTSLKKSTLDNRKVHLNQLLSDSPERLAQLNLKVGSLYFDFSKTHLTDSVLEKLGDLADKVGLAKAINALQNGAIVNLTENQGAHHHFCRFPDEELASLSGAHIQAISKMRVEAKNLLRRLHEQEWVSTSGEAFSDVLHLGIGGSSLGPELVLSSLSSIYPPRYRYHFVANIDGHALVEAMQACDPKKTLVIVCSKTFTTLETLTNARSVIDWLQDAGVPDPIQNFMGITTQPKRAEEFGLAPNNIVSFPTTIGGRYSIWSSVGLPVALILGESVFESFLQGARQMDQHFFSTPLLENAPALAGFLDVWYKNCWDFNTLALFCYDHRLGKLIPYSQQLYMESNGKDRDLEGRSLTHGSAPVLWGGVGTEAQHAVFQLLHQGTESIFCEFIATICPNHTLKAQHQDLLANLLAQTSALALGRQTIDGKGEKDLDFVNASRLFSGNRPSTTIMLEQLDAHTLGSLLAYLEHRTYVSGVLWGINVFDQMGVQLGKEMASELRPVLTGDSETKTLDSSTKNLIKIIRGFTKN